MAAVRGEGGRGGGEADGGEGDGGEGDDGGGEFGEGEDDAVTRITGSHCGGQVTPRTEWPMAYVLSASRSDGF